MNVTVDFNGVEAVLVKSPGSNAWVLNGWKVKPVVAGAGYVAPGATQSSTTTARDGVGAGFATNVPMLSRAGNTPTAAERADAIIARPAVNVRPVDAVMRQLSHVTRFAKLTSGLYNEAGYLLDRFTPEQIKAGVISDYGIPEAVTDRRILMQGAM